MFEEEGNLLVNKIDEIFGRAGVSDHGMLDYILELWNSLAVCFKARIEFLRGIVAEGENEDLNDDKI